MNVRDIASAPVFVAHAAQPLAAAARDMRAHDVGALVVVAEGGTKVKQRPIGIVTDRDIVCGQLVKAADLHCLSVGDVMTPDPLTVAADAGLTEAIVAMSTRGVRRAPVVDDAGELVGIITVDDVLPFVARELGELAQGLDSQTHGGPALKLLEEELSSLFPRSTIREKRS